MDSKKFERDLKQLVARKDWSVLVAEALAAKAAFEVLDEKVSKLYDAVWDRFKDSMKSVRTGAPITKRDLVYLADLESPVVKQYFAECDQAIVDAGYVVEEGCCPARVAEMEFINCRRKVISRAAELVEGSPSYDRLCTVEKITKLFDLLVGLSLCGPHGRSIRKGLLEATR